MDQVKSTDNLEGQPMNHWKDMCVCVYQMTEKVMVINGYIWVVSNIFVSLVL